VRLRRRTLVTLAVAGVAALLGPAAACAAAAPPPLRTAGYWVVADTLAADLDASWDEGAGAFREAPGGLSTHINVAMLLTYSLAARAGHVGPSRHDERAVRILARLIRSPAFRAGSRARAAQGHAPGWRADLVNTRSSQHVSTDARVLEALAAAYVSAPQLALDASTRRLIRSRVCAVARSRFFARPRLNQVNWMADAYASCERVGGGSDLLRGAYRRWLSWFLVHARTPTTARGTTNLNAGLGLHYLPGRSGRATANATPPSEYGNILLTVLGSYDQAVEHGMRPLPPALVNVARRWQARVLYGDWTQAGYLNWDTGLGYSRWHLRRYWAWAAEGLLTIAGTQRLRASPAVAGHAKRTLDAALRLYLRFRSDASSGDMSTSFGVASTAADPIGDRAMVPARFAAIAARAATAGLGEAADVAPAPGSYGFDPDIGRLAVSTGSYSAAIVAPSSLVGYGGAELARLYDASGQPLSGTGGSGPSSTSFGLRLVRRGELLAETQPGRAWPRTAAGLQVAAGAGGGRFDRLRSTATVVGARSVRVAVEHAFEPGEVRVRHIVSNAAGATASLRFPAYGSATFTSTSGTVLDIPVSLSDGAAGQTLHIGLAGGRGYSVVFGSALPAGSRVRVVTAGRARSAPRTVRTLIVDLPVRSARVVVDYRLVPDGV
jgi:hypothetical protein